MASPGPPQSSSTSRVYFKVPYSNKEAAKSLGAKFDWKRKLWYADKRRTIEALAAHFFRPGGEVYFAVAFDEKEEAKAMGAQFDFEDRRAWFAPDVAVMRSLDARFPRLGPKIEALQGEDRDFAGNDLFIDLIPSSCWFKNVRSSINHGDWCRLRAFIRHRSGGICETCREECPNIEAHERFEYEQSTKTQTLKRLVSLCPACHLGE